MPARKRSTAEPATKRKQPKRQKRQEPVPLKEKEEPAFVVEEQVAAPIPAKEEVQPKEEKAVPAEEESDDEIAINFESDDEEGEEAAEESEGEEEAHDEDLFEKNAPVVSIDKSKACKAAQEADENRGVIYLGRIPHGFYEKEMKSYFEQFGTVTRLRLSRNKKSGKSKHYAFIEFKSAEVAKIVVETMHNYLMMGHILQCKMVPKEEVHPNTFVGSNRKYIAAPFKEIAKAKHNKKSVDQDKKRKLMIKKEQQKREKLKELGIEYEFPGYEKCAEILAK